MGRTDWEESNHAYGQPSKQATWSNPQKMQQGAGLSVKNETNGTFKRYLRGKINRLGDTFGMMKLIHNQSLEILGHKTLNWSLVIKHCSKYGKESASCWVSWKCVPWSWGGGCSLTCRASWGPSRYTGNLAGSAPPRRHHRAPLHTPRSLQRNHNTLLTAAALWTTVFSPPANHTQGLKKIHTQRTAQHFILQNTALTVLLTCS